MSSEPAFTRSVHDNDGEPEERTPLRSIQAEVEAEEAADPDGSITVRLETDRGDADIRVPPTGRWRSQARAALFSRGDDFTWAALTLSTADAQTWMKLDPTKDDSDAFFEEWGRVTGQNLAQSQQPNRASRRSRTR